ncbi:hypothetical protein [Streptomyces atratus]|uniref:hypothetical protein n=1 Tax=Streptomyces atratus TaxID=1893 RepID=UPI0033E8197A
MPDRLCLQGILYVLYNDVAWQLLPLEVRFGPAATADAALTAAREAFTPEWTSRQSARLSSWPEPVSSHSSSCEA